MITQSEEQAVAEPTKDEDDLYHLARCYDSDLGLCGADLSNAVEVDGAPDEDWCAVCRELFDNDVPCKPGGCPCSDEFIGWADE